MARKILLADDSVTAQNMGRKILADAGYEVITVNNGSAALKKIAEAKPDLIVLDVYMPGYSGLEVCQRLKEAPDTSRIPVLLTVGKLEPFKPEEARRARAEGFIVKPFEASELLSALTKLEDKMVPRGESSKPGRFARTIAAVEEGRYDKTMAADEDSGWKSRINFPSKKKEKAKEKEEDGEDAAIYNPVNKDLRTVVEPKSAPLSHAAKADEVSLEDSRVDLTAVAPEGLPKDVTAEEIAALAAAAAQIQGKLTETKSPETKSSEAKSPEAKLDEKPVSKTKITEMEVHEAHSEQPVAPVKIEDKVEAKGEVVAEIKEQAQPNVAESAPVVAASEPAAIFEQKSQAEKEEKKIEVLAEKHDETVAEIASLAAPNSDVPGSDVPASIAASDSTQPATGRFSSSSNGDRQYDRTPHSEPEPVTIAMAAAAAASSSPSRWTAVAIALAPEESSIALEDEMRKAYAAYSAASESRSVSESLGETVSSLPETKLPVESAAAPEDPTPVEAIQRNESVQPISTAAPVEPQAVDSVTPVASAASETFHSTVKDFETVTASRVEAQVTAKSEPETALSQTLDSDTRSLEASKSVEASEAASSGTKNLEADEIEVRKDETPVAPISDPESFVAAEASSSHHEQAKYEEPAQSSEAEKNEETATVVSALATSLEEAPAMAAQADEAERAPVEPVATVEPVTGTDKAAADEPAPKSTTAHNEESQIAATTAAAWASWRRIRESRDTKGVYKGKDEEDRDEAAMAVAAGAEKAPGAEEAPELASIVDSVLADLRPKIVEEISKKLKKK